MAVLMVVLFAPASSPAYIEDTPSLGRLIKDSANIYLLEVEKVSKEKRAIVYRKVADLKGKSAGDVKHHIGDGFHSREPNLILDWAEPGKLAICFQTGKTAQVCLGHYWYECVAQEEAPWWSMTRGAPERTLAYFGSVARLRGHITAMLAGRAVVITAVTHGTPAFRGYEPVPYKDLLRGTEFPVWRLRASLAMPRNVYQTATDPKWVVGLGARDVADVPVLVQGLDDKNPHNRADAADELGLIGRAARDAVPALALRVAQDADPLVAVRAAEALLRIDPHEKFVAFLSSALEHEQAKVRRAAAQSLGNVGALAVTALPKLIDCLKDSDGDVRWAAVATLGRIGPEARAAVPVLTEALKDSILRGMAADSLGAIGPDARAAVPGLKRLIESGDKDGRWPAAIALVRIGGPGAEAATPVFIDALKASDAGQRWDALCYLQRLGPRASAAVPAIKALLKSPDAFLRELAVVTVGKIGPDAKAAVPELLPLLGGDDEDLRPRAAVSLAEIGTSALPGLSQQLRNGNADARYWAAQALARVGPMASQFAVFLAERLSDDPDANVRGAAAVALGEIGAEAKGTAGALTAALRDQESHVRILAAEALWKVEKTSERALPVLGKELKGPDVSSRREAAEALGRLNAAAKPALPLLRKTLADKDTDVRVAAAQAVWLVGGDADVVPVLAAALQDKDAESRREAAKILACIGPPAKAAWTGLARLLRDNDPDVRKAAAQAMRRIDVDAAAKAGLP